MHLCGHLARPPTLLTLVHVMVAFEAALLVSLGLFVLGYCIGRAGHPAEAPHHSQNATASGDGHGVPREAFW